VGFLVSLYRVFWMRLSLSPWLRLRGATTKNKRSDKLPLYETVARVLKEIRPADATEGESVFSQVPNMDTFKSDLEKGGIAFVDGQGHRLDFHALRHTFCTIVGGTGILPLIQKDLMRHSDVKQTMAYSHVNNLPKSTAIDQLPNLLEGSQMASQKLGAARLSASFPVTGFKTSDSKEGHNNVGKQSDLADVCAGCRNLELVRRVGIEPTT
jgi:hypothetical protein